MRVKSMATVALAALTVMAVPTIVNAESPLDSMNQNNVITLTQNVTLSELYTIPKGETITIDLNGYTLTGPSSGYTIQNEGTLNIVDNGETKGQISCPANDGSCLRNLGTMTLDGVKAESAFATIKNEPESNLTVKNSEIISTHVGNSLNGGFTGALQNWGTATVDNTTITATSDYAVFARSGAEEQKSSDITITNSTLTGNYFLGAERTDSKTTTQTVNMSNCTLSGRGSGTSANGTVQNYSGNITLTTNHVSVNNTVIANSTQGTSITLDTNYNTTLEIPEGVTVTIPEGRTLTVPVNGVKVMGTLDLQGEIKNNNVYVENTKAYYPTLRDAVQAIPLDAEDMKITILNDTTETRNISVNRKEITVDLNGHTINSTTGITVTTSGNLTIDDTSATKAGTINTTVTNNGILTVNNGHFVTAPTTAEDATTTLLGGTYPIEDIENVTIPEDKVIVENEDGTYSIMDKVEDTPEQETPTTETKEETPSIQNKVEENPNTSDNIIMYFVMATLSATGLGFATYKFKKKNA